MTVTCPCGAEVDLNDDVEAHCPRCGRWAYFAVIGGRPRRVGSWQAQAGGTRLPYDDR